MMNAKQHRYFNTMLFVIAITLAIGNLIITKHELEDCEQTLFEHLIKVN